MSRNTVELPVNSNGFAWMIGLALMTFGCVEDRVIRPAGEGPDAADLVGGADASPSERPDGGGPSSAECDLSGVWIMAQLSRSEALSATQTTVNWFYFDITQGGSRFTINDALNCGFRVTGTTTVTLPDATLAALADKNPSSVGRGGDFAPSGDRCQFSLDRTYNLRGASRAEFLTNHWTMGDGPMALGEFPALPDGPGMEDWDGDGKHGITMTTGFGDRYVASRDWNEHRGMVPQGADTFGGDGEISVDWDNQESVSDQTSALLRASSTAQPPGYAYYKRVGTALTIESSKLATCKNVQRLALETWPSP